jgi:hypothetical protein
MTAETDERKEQLEAAAKSVAAKLQRFQDGLSADEQLMLSMAVGAVTAARRDEDVAGYGYIDGIGEVRDWCLTWQYPWGIPKWPMPQPARLE